MRLLYVLTIIMAAMCLNPIAGHTEDAPRNSSTVVAQVGDRTITRTMLDQIINTIPEERRARFLTPDGRNKILDEVISFTLFAEAARAEGIDQEPAIQTRLDYTATEYLARQYLKRQAAREPQVTEEQVKSYYHDHKDEFTPPEQIKARHILVKTEAKAKEILKELEEGADFAGLAAKYSIDPAASEGGQFELPGHGKWLPKGTFEASFEHELYKIPEGEIGGPIKTQFGWHVLKVDGKRRPQPPDYLQLRSGIKRKLEQERLARIHAQTTEKLKETFKVIRK